MNVNKIAQILRLAGFFFAGAVLVGVSPVSRAATIQEKPEISAAEGEAIKKINGAKDAAAKLDAAAQFVRKFGKSPYRPEVAKYVAKQINSVSDVPQRIKLTEQFLTVFTLPAENDLVVEGLAWDYSDADRAGDAYRIAGAFLQTHPDQIELMRLLAITATNQSIKGNDSFLKQGREYGLKAIAQIEADRKPPEMDAQKWGEYKTKHLVLFYREVGVLAMRAGDKPAAKSNLEKAVALKSTDPIVYLMLSGLATEEYNNRVIQNKAITDKAEQSADLMRVSKILDNLIELYAQTIAVSEGNQQFEAAVNAFRSDLETFYVYRHGSNQGMQALIDKYKKPSP